MKKDNTNYISVKDLAELVDIGKETIRREILKMELKSIKIGKIYRIHKQDALDWMEKKQFILEDNNEKDK